jgi:hypothetical protein
MAEEPAPGLGVLRRILPLGRSPKDVPDKTDGLTLEERSYWLNRLLALADKGTRKSEVWRAEVRAALQGQQLLRPLDEIMKNHARQERKSSRRKTGTTDATSAQPAEIKPGLTDEDIQRLLDAAIRIIATQAVIRLDYSLRKEVRDKVNDQLTRLAWVFIPIIITIVAGGTYAGYVKFQGLISDVKQQAEVSKQTIKDASDKAKEDMEKMTGTLTGLVSDGQQNKGKIDNILSSISSNQQTIVDFVAQATGKINQQNQQLETIGGAIKNTLKPSVDGLQADLDKVTPAVRLASNVVETIKGMPDDLREPILGAAFRVAVMKDVISLFAVGLSVICVVITALCLRRIRRPSSSQPGAIRE